MVREFSVDVDNTLTVTLRNTEDSARKPIINGIELIAGDL